MLRSLIARRPLTVNNRFFPSYLWRRTPNKKQLNLPEDADNIEESGNDDGGVSRSRFNIS